MSKEDRKARLLAHRELEYLRAAAKGGKRRQPPSARAIARKRTQERATKLDEAERIVKKNGDR